MKNHNFVVRFNDGAFVYRGCDLLEAMNAFRTNLDMLVTRDGEPYIFTESDIAYYSAEAQDL